MTTHIPPKNKQYIRRYGLYSSRTRGCWKRFPYIVRLAPHGWKEKQKQENNQEVSLPEVRENSVDKRQERSTWARLIKKVYGIDPLVCPKCSSPMKIIAIIMDPTETEKILRHLVKIGRSPPLFDPEILNS